MSPEAIKQDFESALVKHFSFKARLRSFLYGNDNAQAPLRDPNECSLGQWITSRWHGAYAKVPEMRDLDREHRLIHKQANELMDLRLAGRKEEALVGFQEVQMQADQIVQLLQTIEGKLRTAGV
ncbi:MAG: CZB domain-containing protein [Janthinobacterium lividum]